MKILAVFLFLVVSICACNNDVNNKQPVNNTNTAAKVPVVTIVNDTLIRMQFTAADTGAIATAQHYMNGDEHVVCEVNVQKADSIYATVMPLEATGNVRFSQIVLPGGVMDGPFGQSIHYRTTKAGKYQLIIGENQMAGDKWKGNFKIKVWVK